MLGIAPIVYPSMRRGGPGGADLIVIDQSRAMSATFPSKGTGDAFGAVVMRTDCHFWKPGSRPERELVDHDGAGGRLSVGPRVAPDCAHGHLFDNVELDPVDERVFMNGP
jgi:hypothetical protein